MEPVRVVAAVIECDGRFLGCRRATGKSLAGMWEFPGGKVEPSETDDEALVREINEELGIHVFVHDFIAESFAEVGDLRIHLLGYWCTLAGPEPTSSSDHDLLRWFTPDEFIHGEWAPADIPMLVSIAAIK